MVKVVGLTGGIASGKSTVAALLRERGAAIVDADLLAREVVARIDAGADDMAALSARLFASDSAREAITAFLQRR